MLKSEASSCRIISDAESRDENILLPAFEVMLEKIREKQVLNNQCNLTALSKGSRELAKLAPHVRHDISMGGPFSFEISLFLQKIGIITFLS